LISRYDIKDLCHTKQITLVCDLLNSTGLTWLQAHGGKVLSPKSYADMIWYPDAQLAVVVLTNNEPDTIAVVTEDLAAAVLPVPRPAGPFPGDASLFVGKYQGPGRGTDMVIDVTQTPQGIEFAFDGTAAAPLPYTGGGHFILKRQ
jgi:hypothetical protein